MLYSDIQVHMFLDLFLRSFDQVSVDHLIVALIYVERLLDAAESIVDDPEMACLTENNSKGVLQSAIALAIKFYTDKYERKTNFYASCLKTSMKRMREMTDVFLRMIDFRLVISEEEYMTADSQIVQMIKRRYFNQHGIPLYTEKELKKKRALKTPAFEKTLPRST